MEKVDEIARRNEIIDEYLDQTRWQRERMAETAKAVADETSSAARSCVGLRPSSRRRFDSSTQAERDAMVRKW